ncbi:MAG: hypothetical protein GVY08_07780 [Bacteroidetes bacterium]|nr:hypothetical protein [Bacteroidota bacterium]NBC26744.1 hypothetical protein [Bacteroidota bacterium]
MERDAKRRFNTEQPFLGCETFPQCQYTRDR